MFTDSGISWVLCSVSAFTFRWFPLQGVEDHWLSGYAVLSKTTKYLLKRGHLDSKTETTPRFRPR